jgi:hypothetical protein
LPKGIFSFDNPRWINARNKDLIAATHQTALWRRNTFKDPSPGRHFNPHDIARRIYPAPRKHEMRFAKPAQMRD